LVFMSVLLITLMMEAVKNNRNIGQFIWDYMAQIPEDSCLLK
jgi:hypothetical protein